MLLACEVPYIGLHRILEKPFAWKSVYFVFLTSETLCIFRTLRRKMRTSRKKD